MYYVPLHRMTWMYHKINEKEREKKIISNVFIYLGILKTLSLTCYGKSLTRASYKKEC